MKRGWWIPFALLFLVAPWAPADARSPADFYKGKTIRLLIGAGLGGSQDLFARLIARHIGEYIPGRPNVVPQNMPGAGGVGLLNYLSGAAPRDGLTIGTAPAETVFDPLFGGRSKGEFNPLALRWIGGPVRFSAVAISWNAATPIRKASDLLKYSMKVGATSSASASATDSYVLRHILGFRYEVVLGYPGGADIDLAMQRGETQGRANVAWDGLQSRHPDWVKDGKISLLYQEGLHKNPEIPPNVPLVLDFAKTPSDRALLALKFSSYEVGYPFMTTPDTPPDRLAALRAAMAKALEDPALRAEAKAQRLDIDPISGRETESIIRQAYHAPPAVLQRLVAAMQPPKGSK